MTAIEQKVNNFPSREQVAATALSKVNLVLEQITQEVTEAKRFAIQAVSVVDSGSATILGHVTSASIELKTELKDFIERKFEKNRDEEWEWIP